MECPAVWKVLLNLFYNFGGESYIQCCPLRKVDLKTQKGREAIKRELKIGEKVKWVGQDQAGIISKKVSLILNPHIRYS